MTFEPLVFGLCFLTSSLCAALLFRAYGRRRMPLLLSSALCFVFLAINNLIVVLDMFVILDTSLLLYRHIAALLALGVLLFGFIWDTQ